MTRVRQQDILLADQVRVYKVSRGWKSFYLILCAPLCVLFGWVVLTPFRESGSGSLESVGLALAGAGLLSLFIYVAVAVFKEKLEIFPDRIRAVGVFRTTEHPLDSIGGFRILETPYMATLVLEPGDFAGRKIQTYLWYENKEELLEWLCVNFADLDETDSQDEREEVLADGGLGSSEEERLRLPGGARRWAGILNAASVAVCLWVVIRPEPYEYAIWTLVLFPLLALAFLHYFRGALRIESKRGGLAPAIDTAFLMPALGLGARAVMDWDVLNWESFWLPFGAFSLALFLLTYFISEEIRRKTRAAAAHLLICAFYAYGAVVSLNGIMDDSVPAVEQALIVEKRTSKGSITSYYLKLSPWGPREEEREVPVTRRIYEDKGAGDSVEVVVHAGAFGIPWFYIR
jgi:hypothetical protein